MSKKNIKWSIGLILSTLHFFSFASDRGHYSGMDNGLWIGCEQSFLWGIGLGKRKLQSATIREGKKGEIREQACVPLTFHDPPGSYCRLPVNQPEQKTTLDCLPGIKKMCGRTEMWTTKSYIRLLTDSLEVWSPKKINCQYLKKRNGPEFKLITEKLSKSYLPLKGSCSLTFRGTFKYSHKHNALY